jgi:AraC-like DNA-binding protein
LKDIDMNADVLSDVLRAVRLTGAVYFDFELTSPWVLAAPTSDAVVGRVVPGAQRVIEYHLIADGTCWAARAGDSPVQLATGDLIVFPRGDAHVLSSAPGMHDTVDLSVFDPPLRPLPLVRRIGGSGPERARVVCCFLGCDDRPFNPLLAALPPVIHLSAAGDRDAHGWLASLVTIAARESGSERPGAENILSRVSELMFVETIRRHIESLPATGTGWLSGLRDPMVGRALAALHEAPRDAWTVDRLARVVGTSRSVLAERFTALVGDPPMQYLALWRMQLASRLLMDGDAVASVADAVGYESEAAFSRAFKKLSGHSPGAWRRGKNGAGAAGGHDRREPATDFARSGPTSM